MMSAISLVPAKTFDTAAIKQTASYLSYNFFTFNDASPQVLIYSLPTLPLNKDYSMRCAVSIDDGPLQMVDITSKSTARTEEWKQNVLSNRAVRKIEMPRIKKGKHTLKIYGIDPGVIMDEIQVDLGGLKKAYSAIAETKKQV